MGWIRRLGATLRHSQATDAFDEEARFHIEQRVDDYIRDGMSPEEARREAQRRFGSVTRARERTREVDTLPWLADAMQDLRYAARQLRRNPGLRAHRHPDAGHRDRGEHRPLRRRERTAAQAAAGCRRRANSCCSTGSKAARACARAWTASEPPTRRRAAPPARPSRIPRSAGCRRPTAR